SPGAQIWDVSSQGVWNGWSCNGSAWEMKSSSASLYSAFYYVHGNIKISASPSSPWQASFVTAGNIEIGCCTYFIPYGNTGNTIADNIFLLAGNDISVFGSPGNIIDGVIAAHGNVKLSGSQSHFRGSVIAEDYKYGIEGMQEVTTNVQSIKDPTSINLINSNVIVEGTGIGLTSTGDKVAKAGWRELSY
ncbi:MAG: hypothetical protein R3348_09910, partial [Xanthomonadales bacterium]|nr:hypothetical protein [Xanthomonadales bacterium]